MKPAQLQTHDVLGANSANGQCVADERAMTAPGHRFRAHQCDPVFFRELNQFFDLLLEFRRLHVIGVASKRCIPPTGIERVALCMPQTAETRHVNIPDAGFLQ